MPVRALDAGVFLVLLAVGAAVFWPIVGLRPLGGDNFYVLAWVDAASIGDLLRVDPAIYPEWRPLPFLSIWLEHRLVQLEQVAIHHSINFLIWLSCSWLVYRIVHHLTASPTAGAGAAVFVLTDPRSISAMVWIVERQMSMACAFGLVAMLILLKAEQRPLTRPEWVGVFAALLASALSKEYGLAFAGALAVHAAWRRQVDRAWLAGSALVAYGSLRVGLAGGALGPYCEDMGFLFDEHYQCIGGVSAAHAPQMAYNVWAAAVGTPFRGLFDEGGQFKIDLSELVLTASVLSIAVVGMARGPRVLRLIALVIGGNVLLGFMVYRDRNLLVGVCGIAILFGVGMAWLRAGIEFPLSRAVRTSAVLVTVAALAFQAFQTRALVSREVADMLVEDPCEADAIERDIGKRFVLIVNQRYGLGAPTCEHVD